MLEAPKEVTLHSNEGGGEGFDVSKSGEARVGLIGFPSVGKSTLLTKVRSPIISAHGDLLRGC